MQNSNLKVKSDICQRCYVFGLRILRLCDSLPQRRSAQIISDQLLRSATSIGANLIEGKAASSRLEFKKFYEIALKSANETKYWLLLLHDAKLTDGEHIDDLLGEADEICRILAQGIISLKRKTL